MATLVLTVVGGVIGGPIGAAIGGLVGNAVDHAAFGPPPRGGPRLTELSVQTSSYGTPIPKVFGTMRVAGSVIWATDLIEHRSTDGGGKGQPSVTSYSYTASFAVALSSRAIVSVGRIWADGNLLRGAAGDWKTQTGFRLYPGGEAQDADPLIASLEEAGLTPAHRGVAYAVFEDLHLADFGNRIPSLTFEVTADPAPPTIADVAVAIGGGAIAAEPIAATLDGFSAYGDSARSVAEMLARAADGWFAAAPESIELRAGGGAALAIEDAGFGADGPRRGRTVTPIDRVARTLALAHYDPARDYQTGVQQVSRPGAGVRAERFELPAALGAGPARTLAAAMLARGEVERVRRTVSLDIAGAGIAPGDRVGIAGEAGTWRVTAARIEGMAATLDLVPLSPGSLPIASTPGRVVGAPDLEIGTTVIHAFELPNLDETLLTQPRVLIAAAGTGPGWRRAALLTSLDDGASWSGAGSTALPATMGVVAVPPGDGTAAMRDLANAIEVELLHEGMSLASVDDAALDAGANLVVVGGELLQFGVAAQLSATRWRLTRLLRARRGVAAAHVAGEPFTLLAAECVAAVTLPVAAIGKTLRVLASGVGDTSGPAAGAAVVGGASVAPPSPVRLTATPLVDGATRVAWIRRSRLGWAWRDGGEAPLGEEREAYRVTITAEGASRSVVVAAPEVLATPAEAAAGAEVSVRQLGTIAESGAARITLG